MSLFLYLIYLVGISLGQYFQKNCQNRGTWKKYKNRDGHLRRGLSIEWGGFKPSAHYDLI